MCLQLFTKDIFNAHFLGHLSWDASLGGTFLGGACLGTHLMLSSVSPLSLSVTVLVCLRARCSTLSMKVSCDVKVSNDVRLAVRLLLSSIVVVCSLSRVVTLLASCTTTVCRQGIRKLLSFMTVDLVPSSLFA